MGCGLPGVGWLADWSGCSHYLDGSGQRHDGALCPGKYSGICQSNEEIRWCNLSCDRDRKTTNSDHEGEVDTK